MLSRPILVLNKSLTTFCFLDLRFFLLSTLKISYCSEAQCWKSYCKSSIINWNFLVLLKAFFVRTPSFFAFIHYYPHEHKNILNRNLSEIVFFHQLWLLRNFNENKAHKASCKMNADFLQAFKIAKFRLKTLNVKRASRKNFPL